MTQETSSLPPDWAIERANKLSNLRENIHYIKKNSQYYRTTLAFAKYLSEKEEPPVDPDLVTAREIALELCGYPPDSVAGMGFTSGKNDKLGGVKAALAGIKKGRELAGEGNSE